MIFFFMWRIMDVESVRKFEEILDKERKSIGVRNTNKRIHMIYGEKYGVTISSQLEEGTVVTISLR